MEKAEPRTNTRVREALATKETTSPASSPKIRKLDLKFSLEPSFTNQLKSIGEKEAVPEAAEERCTNPTASDESPASCCSNNGSFPLDQERIKFLDLEVQSSQAETSTCNRGHDIRRDMSFSSELGPKANSHCVKMPTELDLEEFLASAEKDIQKRFSDKYNYDIVKDVPLEGRYEWVQLNP